MLKREHIRAGRQLQIWPFGLNWEQLKADLYARGLEPDKEQKMYVMLIPKVWITG
jgi:hypothetical protein